MFFGIIAPWPAPKKQLLSAWTPSNYTHKWPKYVETSRTAYKCHVTRCLF